MKSKNKLIILEGIDGVGKTTIALELKKFLKKKGLPVILYEDYERKHPGFNLLKPLAKNMPITGSHFFYLASSVYKSGIIKKLLKTRWVICDRYFYSTNAYHKTKGSNLKITQLNELLKPDYAFLLTLDEKIRQERIKQKSNITKQDLIPKTKGSLPFNMEENLKKMKLKKINNSTQLKETLKKITGLIFKRK